MLVTINFLAVFNQISRMKIMCEKVFPIFWITQQLLLVLSNSNQHMPTGTSVLNPNVTRTAGMRMRIDVHIMPFFANRWLSLNTERYDFL